MVNKLFNNAVSISEKMADYLWQKQKITMNNIANGSTPGFKAQYVTFEDEFKMRVSKGKSVKASEILQDIEKTNIRTHTKKDESTRMDGNNVDLDVEEIELASTNIQYQYALRSLTDEFSRLRSVIR